VPSPAHHEMFRHRRPAPAARPRSSSADHAVINRHPGPDPQLPERSLRFRVLGRVGAWRGNTEITIGSDKQRTLLGLLLLGSGAPVPRRVIVDALWGSSAPASTVNLIHTYVSRLRRGIDSPGGERGQPGGRDRSSWLVRVGSAYAIRPQDCDLDLLHFRSLLERAERVIAPPERLSLQVQALALWREPGSSGHDHPLAGHPWLRTVEQARVDTVLAAAEASVELGLGRDVVPHLRDVAAAEPLNEAVHAALMVCLAASGSPGQALREYATVRRRLVDDLGIEPGPLLRAAHAGVLVPGGPTAARLGITAGNTADEATGAETVGAEGGAAEASQGARAGPAASRAGADWPCGCPAGPRPALLPADLPDFTGRRHLVSALRTRLTDRDRRLLPVVLLTGESGVGKSALAVHLAHELAPYFPDGQLYAEMTGADGKPIGTGRVLAGLLRALGVDAGAVPADLAEAAGLYRSLLAGRRVLVVLDDLLDQGQLTPLLPGGPSCAVLGSSRAGSTDFPGHQVVEVDPLSGSEGLALMAAIIGDDRVAQDPAAAAELVRLCDSMPLALRVAAARLAGRRQWSLERMARRLAVPERRLDELSVAGYEVRAGLAQEYEALDLAGRRAFRRLGRLDAPSVATWMAAAGLELSVEATEELLAQLTDRRLARFAGVDAAGQSRYQIRGLAKVFARERAALEDGEPGARTSLARTLAALAGKAQDVLQGRAALDPLLWLLSEQACILASARQARDLPDDELAMRLHGFWTGPPVPAPPTG
jgi:DNA-binding SARP family transcriptional activator